MKSKFNSWKKHMVKTRYRKEMGVILDRAKRGDRDAMKIACKKYNINEMRINGRQVNLKELFGDGKT